MKLETLYKRSKTGSIVFYTSEVVPQNEDETVWDIIKTTGQLGTIKPLRHIETVCVGKNLGKTNETTPYEQASLQLKSDYEKKRDTGYKSLKELGVEPIIGNDYNLDIQLQLVLPQFNSDASGNSKPMKAPNKPWKVGKKLNFPQFIEPKLDGLRTIIEWDFTSNNKILKILKILSSSGKDYTNLNHIQDAFVNNSKNLSLKGKLDGEVYLHGLLLEEINSAVKKENENTIKLKFHIYDTAELEVKQSERTSRCMDIITLLDDPIFPKLESVLAHSEEEILEWHNKWVEEGYEGAMLKDPNGFYQPGQRSSYWNKVKMFDDAEFEVVGFELGQRGIQDLSFICKLENGTFNTSMNGSLASKQKLFENINNCIGKQLTVKYFGLSKYGVPNLPKGKCFRED